LVEPQAACPRITRAFARTAERRTPHGHALWGEVLIFLACLPLEKGEHQERGGVTEPS
jgi:hypothetical protein